MPDMILLEVEEKMETSIEQLNNQLSKISTGRANPNLLNGVKMNYYGAPTPISQIAAISVPEAQQLMIKPFDASGIKDLEKAIIAHNLGFTINNDGKVIRISIPALTEDRRKQFAKDASKTTEEIKVKIRNARRDGNDSLKKLDLPEDDLKGYMEDVQTLTDKFVAKADSIFKDKEKELMTI